MVFDQWNVDSLRHFSCCFVLFCYAVLFCVTKYSVVECSIVMGLEMLKI